MVFINKFITGGAPPCNNTNDNNNNVVGKTMVILPLFFLWNGGTIFDGFGWFIAPSYDFGDGLIMNLMNCPLTMMIDLYMAFHIYEHLYMICVLVWVCMYMLYIYYGNTCLCSGLTRAYRNCTSLHAWRIWNCTWQSWPSSMPIS